MTTIINAYSIDSTAALTAGILTLHDRGSYPYIPLGNKYVVVRIHPRREPFLYRSTPTGLRILRAQPILTGIAQKGLHKATNDYTSLLLYVTTESVERNQAFEGVDFRAGGWPPHIEHPDNPKLLMQWHRPNDSQGRIQLWTIPYGKELWILFDNGTYTKVVWQGVPIITPVESDEVMTRLEALYAYYEGKTGVPPKVSGMDWCLYMATALAREDDTLWPRVKVLALKRAKIEVRQPRAQHFHGSIQSIEFVRKHAPARFRP
jgi:hypothetical protein